MSWGRCKAAHTNSLGAALRGELGARLRSSRGWRWVFPVLPRTKRWKPLSEATMGFTAVSAKGQPFSG